MPNEQLPFENRFQEITMIIILPIPRPAHHLDHGCSVHWCGFSSEFDHSFARQRGTPEDRIITQFQPQAHLRPRTPQRRLPRHLEVRILSLIKDTRPHEKKLVSALPSWRIESPRILNAFLSTGTGIISTLTTVRPTTTTSPYVYAATTDAAVSVYLFLIVIKPTKYTELHCSRARDNEQYVKHIFEILWYQ